MSALVIAIDGPAAAGKSTTARGVARRLGLLYVDTGAMYRALAIKVIRLAIHADDEEAIERLVGASSVALEPGPGGGARVVLDGEDVSAEIRDERVGGVASAVSRLKVVRSFLVDQQRLLAHGGGVVMEGRDIGTVVLPQADLKVFLVAGAEERSRRRRQELLARGVDLPLEEVRRRIEERDRRDRERQESPLRAASDAVTIDTTDLTVEEQIEAVLAEVERLGARSGSGVGGSGVGGSGVGGSGVGGSGVGPAGRSE